jgi:hypothetical protein
MNEHQKVPSGRENGETPAETADRLSDDLPGPVPDPDVDLADEETPTAPWLPAASPDEPGALLPGLKLDIDRLVVEMKDGPRERFQAAFDELRSKAENLPPGSEASRYILNALRNAAPEPPTDPDAPGDGPVHRWFVHRADKPDAASAEVVFQEEEADGRGRLEVVSDEPALRSLILYYLTDPNDLRPLHFPEAGTLPGSPKYFAGHVDRVMSMLPAEYPGFSVRKG